jgi:pyruvate,orthophosphate dikinase
VVLEVMVPFVSTASEVIWVRDRVLALVDAAGLEPEARARFAFGTMIELPRAALRAADIAQSVDFFSFGTNDLTQTTFGISRDDAASFIGAYTAAGILPVDPFVTIDQDGVGALIQIAAERGRATRPSLKLGICGEHGGDPASIAFCEDTDLDYVSCSPFRVPIARLAAAQAALRRSGKRGGGSSTA